MGLTDIFLLLGGIALFLYGMKIMAEGLNLLAGEQMKKILEKLTNNIFVAMLVGTIVTATIQSSTAVTVMVVGFVNAGMMTLIQAVGVIMGANIGTTITSQLVAFDIAKVAPLIAFVGFLIITLVKKEKIKQVGEVVIGLGILFIGMNSMSDAMAPLKDVQEIKDVMTRFSNPLLGVLIGTVVTCIIQSSSASVGILQAIASQGLISLTSSIYIVFGQNIGTCLTAIVATIGTNKNAIRAAVSHVLINVIGTILFIFIVLVLPVEEWIISMSPNNVVRQIANVHTIFNIGSAILLLPLTKLIVRLSVYLVPDGNKSSKQSTL